MRRNLLTVLAAAVMMCLPVSAQITLKGIGHDNRYDNGDKMTSTYLGWNSELGKAVFIVDNGIYAMSVDGNSVTTPVKDPAVDAEVIKGNNDLEIWANNFNQMMGNSGAVYVNGKLVTVFSRDESSTTDEELFAVRKWDAATGNLLSSGTYPKSATLESAGMSYNPKDGKVYGLFYLTARDLPESITSDPDYFTEEDDALTDGDAGYAICTIDLATMTVTPITPGLYYYNFITFAINSDGRAFALTSGGTNGTPGDDGKIRDINGNLSGAQLYEFNLETGLMMMNPVDATDENGEHYTAYEPVLPATGYCSQYKRQAACFAGSKPNVMYWVGYVNSGKGVNDWGSWGPLPDREWRTNGKYDTALYRIDITTGECEMVQKIDNRWTFSALWVDGDDPSDGSDIDPFDPGNITPTEGCYIALQQADNGSIWQLVDMGQQYTYFIEPSDGWAIHSVTFNGEELTVANGNYVTTPAVAVQYNRLIVTFEQKEPSGINDTPAANLSQARILGSDSGIHITNANVGDKVIVCNMDGRVVYSRTMTSNQADISLRPDTLYIIKVADKVVKVRL